MSEVGKILVVDDLEANLVALEAALAPLDRPVMTARSGEEALALLAAHDFALALLDVNMPVMDGFELAHRIRSRERLLPIIFTTATAHDPQSVARAYELGAVDFLPRPVVPEILRAKASVFVTLREQRRERDAEHEENRRKDGFIAILAHELRNPLAPLRTCIDLIREQPTAPLKPRMIEALDRQTRVLERLVDDLLDVARIKADKIELRPERVEIAEVVAAALATSRPLIDARNHTVVQTAPSEPLVIVADTVRLSQVLCNVLNNAARYTEPGGLIEIAITFDDDNAIVRVRDNGIGIPHELQQSMFDMFVQERVRSDGSGGLGLGLALSRRLVEMHNGTIEAYSEGAYRGSTFSIAIPRAGSQRSLPTKRRTGDMAPLRRDARAIRTIVIDDNEDARDLLCALLRGRGHEVLTAPDGQSGVALILEHQPDVALVDLGLPVLDGFGVIEILRRQRPDLKTRLIALTGYGTADDYARTKEAGFHAHLVKPASSAAIFDCVTRQLEDDA